MSRSSHNQDALGFSPLHDGIMRGSLKPAGRAPANMNKDCWNNSAHILQLCWGLTFTWSLLIRRLPTCSLGLRCAGWMWLEFSDVFIFEKANCQRGASPFSCWWNTILQTPRWHAAKGGRKKRKKRGKVCCSVWQRDDRPGCPRAPSSAPLLCCSSLHSGGEFSEVAAQASAHAHTKDHGPFCVSGFDSIRSFSSGLFISVLVSISSVNRTITKARQSTDTHTYTHTHTGN